MKTEESEHWISFISADINGPFEVKFSKSSPCQIQLKSDDSEVYINVDSRELKEIKLCIEAVLIGLTGK